MGEVFRYVADRALPAHRHVDIPCPVCGKSGDVYYIRAHVGTPGEDEDLISEACTTCIRAFDSDQVPAWDTERRLPAYLKSSTPGLSKEETRTRLASIRQELRRTPRLPHFVQWDDWPFCCGDLAEYTGEPSPAEAELLDREGHYWNRGPASFHQRAAELVPSDRLAVLGGVSAFGCPRCGKRYWTFQCT